MQWIKNGERKAFGKAESLSLTLNSLFGCHFEGALASAAAEKSSIHPVLIENF
jgi:hypothetical protein